METFKSGSEGAGGKGLLRRYLACGLPNVNPREALERLLARIQGRLRRLPLDEEAAKAIAVYTQAISRPLRGPSPSDQVARHGRRESRVARWEAVRVLHAMRTPIRQIAKTLSLSWTTARNFAYAESL